MPSEPGGQGAEAFDPDPRVADYESGESLFSAWVGGGSRLPQRVKNRKETYAEAKRKGPAPNANQAQLRAAMRDGMDKTMVFCLAALMDKFGWDQEQLVAFVGAVASVSDSYLKGYVDYNDLHRVLVEEQGLEW